MKSRNNFLLKILAFGIVLIISLQVMAGKSKLPLCNMVDTSYVTKMPEFTDIQNVEHLNSQWSDFSTIPNEGGMFFISSREREKYILKYQNKDECFFDVYYYEDEGTKPFTAINYKFHGGPLCFDSSGNTMYYSRNSKKVSGKNDRYTHMLFRVERKGENWDKDEVLPFSNVEYSCFHPALFADGSVLYFASDMPGGFGGMDLYKVVVNEDGTFGKPVNLGENINTPGNEVFPFIHNDGMLFFSSDGYREGFGKLDIYLSFPYGENYSKPQNLGNNLNSESDDFAFYLDKEQKTGYFSSDRNGGEGSDDIYSFIMSGSFDNKVFVMGIITSTSELIGTSGILVKILDEKENVIEQVSTDENGEFELSLPIGSVYNVLLELDNSFVDMRYDILVNASENTIELCLKLDSAIIISGELIEQTSRNLVGNVNVTVTSSSNNVSKRILTPDGKFAFITEPENEYDLKLEKNGCLTKVFNFSTVGMKPGEKINLNASIDLEIVEVKVGETDLTKAIHLQPVYFEYRSYKITEKATVELDKVVKSMKENPNMMIELGSHTDCRGSDSFNLKLSDDRAKASAQYIIEQGMEESRIIGKGYGETRLINKCDDGVKCSDEEHALNRRTEFKIVKF